jgi:predicted small lipoprotein YifL
LDRRRFTLMFLPAALALGASACGRRGPLEPPAYTAQGREWERRTARNTQQNQPRGSVQEGLQRDQDDRNTRDVEADIERGRSEGVAQVPTDPTQPEPAAVGPTPTGGRRRPPGIVPPKRAFILDPLLE